MAHDVFISHASEDKAIADAVCAMLEGQNVRCWIAPRDIRPGDDWGECIIEGIKHARVFVLVFSHQANSSPHIPREVERAVSHGIPIIPLRIEQVLPEGSLEYNLATVHWLDAMTPPVEAHIKRLADTVHAILGTQPPERSDEKQESRQRTDPWPRVVPSARPKMLIPAAIGLAVVAALGTYLYFNRQPTQVTTPDTPQQSSPSPSSSPTPPPSNGPRPPANPPAVSPPPADVTPPDNGRGAARGTPEALRADMKSRALAQPRWFQCSLESCTFGGYQSYGQAIKRIEFGENSGKLDRWIEVPGWDVPIDPRQQGVDRWRLDNIPIRPGSGELYVRLVFYDGSTSDVRPAIMQPNRDHVAGVRLEPFAFSFGLLPELSLFAGFTPGRTGAGLVFKPEAPVDATAAYYSIDDGPFRPARALDHGTTTDIGFEFETPVEDATIHVRFTMPDGSQIGPIGYTLKNAAAIPLSAFKERLSLELDQEVACTRVPFTLPLPDANTGSLAERQANQRDAAQIRVLFSQRGVNVTTAPTVACVPERTPQTDLSDWAAVKEVHAGTQTGKLDQVQPVQVSTKDAVARHVDTQNRWRIWQVQLPASAQAVFFQFVFYDGTRSKEFSVGIETLRLAGRTP